MNSNVFAVGRVACAVLGAALWLSLPAWAEDESWVADARKISSALPPKMLDVLNAQIAKEGPAFAVGMCNEKAPQMAKTASEQSGWAIRRVSLRNRNPKAVPDAWEQAALEDFDRRAAAGETPTTLEKFEVIDNAGTKEYRYMKALPMQQLCLACHGAAEALAPDVAAQIHARYPADKAVGYSVGQLRGAVTLRKAL